MLRGTRIIEGDEVVQFNRTTQLLRCILQSAGYQEVILPALWEQQTFIDKAGPEIIGQMWAFQDKGGRDVCLIPEATAIVQQQWRENWSKTEKVKRIFYLTKCYRYERPQLGRYREFWQFGIELLGDAPYAYDETLRLLNECMESVFGTTFPLKYQFDTQVKRGLSYYTDLGFEVRCDQLGAQKQIAGGGKHAEGTGWAIGVDRLLLALKT